MEYFSVFPSIVYNKKTMTDISKRVDFINRIKGNVSLYQYHILHDGQRPEDVALQYYKDVKLFWIILFLNNMVDPYYDWLLTDSQLYTYVGNKYGVENIYSVHHYESTDGHPSGVGIWLSKVADSSGTLDEIPAWSTPIDNWTYEFNLNETKRNIKILRPSYITQVLNEFVDEMSE